VGAGRIREAAGGVSTATPSGGSEDDMANVTVYTNIG